MKILFKSMIIAVSLSALLLTGCHRKQAPQPVYDSSYQQAKKPAKRTGPVQQSKKVSSKQQMHLYTK